jgi:peptidase E
MASFNKFNSFTKAVAEKVHNLGSDAIKVALSNTAPVATNALLADITQIAVGNGYVAGGNAATLVSSTQSSGVYKLILNDVTFTASGGSIATFRYIVVYNSTATNSELIGWYDFGTAVNITDTNSFVVDLDQVNGILTIT